MNANQIKSILFDMDGVLYDSMPLHEKSWKAAFKTINVDYPTEMIYMNEGRPGRETIVEVFNALLNQTPDKETVENLYQTKSRIMESMGRAGLIDGMETVVERLNEKNYVLCVVTGSSQKSLLNYVNHHYNGRFDSNFITGEDVSKGKPDPEPYLKALKMTGSDPGEAIVIENAPLGIKAAKAAGIYTLALNSGKLKRMALEDAGADVVFDDSDELIKWIKENLV